MRLFPNKKWLELVAETQRKVLDERDKRGAGEKPILKKYNKETGEFIDKVNPLAPLLQKINNENDKKKSQTTSVAMPIDTIEID